MVNHMNDKHIKNLNQVRLFLEGTEALEPVIEEKRIGNPTLVCWLRPDLVGRFSRVRRT